MSVLERYVACMNAHDVKGITDCWVKGGIFNDVSAKEIVGIPGYFVGKGMISLGFRIMFVMKPRATILRLYENGTEMDYDILIKGKNVRCHGTIEKEEDGKFKVYSCKPRSLSKKSN